MYRIIILLWILSSRQEIRLIYCNCIPIGIKKIHFSQTHCYFSVKKQLASNLAAFVFFDDRISGIRAISGIRPDTGNKEDRHSRIKKMQGGIALSWTPGFL